MKTIIIKSKQLITDASKPPLPAGIVIVREGLIQDVGTLETIVVPQDSGVIDCSEDTVLPGLIDTHMHITANNKYRIPLQEHFTIDLPTAVLRGSMNLRMDLASGVTTARTLGDRPDVEVHFRNAIERGEIPGPRLVICHRALRPSHGTAKFIATSADGTDQLRRSIRENFAMGAQVLKLFVTNVMNGDTYEDYLRGDLTDVPAYSKEEIFAAVDEAHTLGMKVAAHAIGGPAMRWAMEAGVDSVEHANLLEERDIEHFVKHNLFLSDPNLQLFFDEETGFETFETWKYDWWRKKVVRAQAMTRSNIPLAVKAGVKVCLGTDSWHSFLWKEAKHFVDIGASTQDALLAVTKNSAELLGMADQIGTIERGKLADVISVRGNPLEDITALKEVRLVMKGGRQYSDLL